MTILEQILAGLQQKFTGVATLILVRQSLAFVCLLALIKLLSYRIVLLSLQQK